MIRFHHTYAVYKKELLEVVRDRRALFLTVVFPLILYPVMFLVASQIALKSHHDIQAEEARVAVVPNVPPALASRFEPDDNLVLVAEPDISAALGRLGAEGIEGVLDLSAAKGVFPGDGDGTIDARIHFDSTREVSSRVRDQLEEALEEIRNDLLKDRLARRGLPASFTRPVAVAATDVAPPAAVGGHLLGKIAPLLIIMMIALGAFYPAIEVTVGEKERGTLQTLLTAPIAALEIVTGKFLSVFTVALIAGAANIASMALLLLLAAALPGDVAGAMALELGFGQIVALLLLTGLTGLLLSAVMMAVATAARTNKEAQAWMTPVYLLCVLPPMVAQIPGLALDGILPAVPLLGHALLMRDLLEGPPDLGNLFSVAFASLLFTAAALVLAAKIFQHEATVLGDTSFFRGGTAADARPVPASGNATAFLALVFILIFYGGSLLQAWRILPGVALTQWLLLLVPCLVFLRWQRADLKLALGLRAPPWSATAASVLFGVAIWYPIMLASAALQGNGASDPSRKALEEMFAQILGADVPTVVLVFVIAVSPAVCEEVLFRGVLLRSYLTGLKPRTAVILTSVLFGAFHMSAERFIPTAALGLLLGTLALRSGSIWPGMLFHALHNGISVVLAREGVSIPGITEPGAPVLWQVLAASVSLGLGAILLIAAGRRTRA